MTLPEVRDRFSPNHAQRVERASIDMLVLHYTGMKTAGEAIERMCDPEARVSAHLCHRGERDNLAARSRDTAGVSCRPILLGGRVATSTRSRSGSRSSTPATSGVTGRFRRSRWPRSSVSPALFSRFPIPPDRVVGHSDIAPDRKADPGELFDWPRLARAGIGTWPEPASGLAHRRGRGVGSIARRCTLRSRRHRLPRYRGGCRPRLSRPSNDAFGPSAGTAGSTRRPLRAWRKCAPLTTALGGFDGIIEPGFRVRITSSRAPGPGLWIRVRSITPDPALRGHEQAASHMLILHERETSQAGECRGPDTD